MNNFLVSQKENKRYGVWLWVIVLAALVISVWPVTVTPITGYNGLDAMQQLLTANYIRIPFTAIYWIAFFWMLWQITAHVSKQHRWLKTALWMAICSGIAMVLAGWLVPMPDVFSSEMEWRQVGIGILSVLFEVGMIWVGWLLVRNNGGRLRQLGVSILAWVLIPILLRLLVNIFWQSDILHTHAFKAVNMVNSLLQLALGITVFWAMRRSFVPNWE